jgi:capsular polysaccharide export protein
MITGDPILEKIRGGTVTVCTRGLARIASDIEALLDARVIYRPAFAVGSSQAIVGWGHKPTADAARRAAEETGIPYIAIEDGFLRSVRPGPGEPSSSYVIDTQGIYYDARSPSSLGQHVAQAAELDSTEINRARAAIGLLKKHRLSKYNAAPPLSWTELGLGDARNMVLVADQTFGDASIPGALADETSFASALQLALKENPEATIAIKVHPETVSGRKRGYLADLKQERRVHLIARDVEPASLFAGTKRVYAVSSLLGFEALLAGVPVTTFGAAFYAGWGLTTDRHLDALQSREVSLPSLFHAAYLNYSRYLDAWTRAPIDFEIAVDQLAFLKRRHLENGPSICLGMTMWKRKSVRRFLDGRGGSPVFMRSSGKALAMAEKTGHRIVVWASREPANLGDVCRTRGIPLHRLEDGFLRSVGLGASFIQPASLILDGRGIYYDPSHLSDFEAIASEAAFSLALLSRARALRERILKARLSKYNEGSSQSLNLPPAMEIVLVPGQVEDDAAIKLGTRKVTTNLELLKAARKRNPHAYLVYKPHPDVEAGYRKGKIGAATALQFADLVVTRMAMPDLLEHIDRVETMTSLTGFEALLRGKKVAVHGQPFYAGWGLTDDLDPVPRRTRKLSLDELLAVTLILYPRYLDPVTGRHCEVETIVARLEEAKGRRKNLSQKLLSGGRHAFAWCIHNLILPLTKRG